MDDIVTEHRTPYWSGVLAQPTAYSMLLAKHMASAEGQIRKRYKELRKSRKFVRELEGELLKSGFRVRLGEVSNRPALNYFPVAQSRKRIVRVKTRRDVKELAPKIIPVLKLARRLRGAHVYCVDPFSSRTLMMPWGEIMPVPKLNKQPPHRKQRHVPRNESLSTKWGCPEWILKVVESIIHSPGKYTIKADRLYCRDWGYSKFRMKKKFIEPRMVGSWRIVNARSMIDLNYHFLRGVFTTSFVAKTTPLSVDIATSRKGRG